MIYKKEITLYNNMSLKLPAFPTEYLEITFIDETTDIKEYTKLQSELILPFAASEIINASLKSATYLTQGDDVKKVMEICMNIEGRDLIYHPGNTIGILPQNCGAEVNKIIDRLNYNEFADKLFTLSVKETNIKKKFKIPPHVPVIGSVRETLLHNLDIRHIPKKTFLRALTKYTENEDEANQLNDLCSSDKYMQLITYEYVPLLELLKMFPTCFPPFTVLLEHLPRLLPRPYSLTCSPLKNNSPNLELQFIFSKTSLPNSYEGICSGWMNKMIENSLETKDTNIPFYLRKSNNFVLPEDAGTNIIMIATGTGIAPFISFLRHREIGKNERNGSILLFYGCRYCDRDFLYKHEIEKFVNNGTITKLYTSFSRESNTVKYVQDNIVLHSKNFVEMLEQNSVLYVCGGKNMSKCVFETIINCVHDNKHITLEEAQKFVSELRKNNKYIEDIWD